MALNLAELVKGYLTPDIVQKAVLKQNILRFTGDQVGTVNYLSD